VEKKIIAAAANAIVIIPVFIELLMLCPTDYLSLGRYAFWISTTPELCPKIINIQRESVTR
jgi:hypothetical protein